MVQNAGVPDPAGFDDLAGSDHALSPEECAELARAAADRIDLTALERGGPGSATLLWRGERSEAWLNTWWEERDTGFHDHGGSCVGVYVLEGGAETEGLVVGGPRRAVRYGAGDAFSLPHPGIHRVAHAAGTVTVHVYAPPLREIGHYEVVDGELQRHGAPPDEVSPPSPVLSATLAGPVRARPTSTARRRK
jgi:hypothetical protein